MTTGMLPLRGMHVSADFSMAVIDSVNLYRFVRVAVGYPRCYKCGLRGELCSSSNRRSPNHVAFCGADTRPDGSYGYWNREDPESP